MARFYDVAIAIRTEHWEELNKRAEQIADEKAKELANGLLGRADTDNAKPHIDGYMFVTWYDEDWQDDFLQVKFVMDFLEEIKDYSFVRNATDDDSEQPVIINNKHFLLSIDRSIHFGT